MLFRKKKEKKIFDREHQKPALRCSICTGEQVAGFLDMETGKFEEIVCIRGEADLEEFLESYDIRREELTKVY